MTSVQIEIFNAFRALGMSEARALKAAAALNRRDSAALQNQLRQFKLFGALLVLLAAALAAYAIR